MAENLDDRISLDQWFIERLEWKKKCLQELSALFSNPDTVEEGTALGFEYHRHLTKWLIQEEYDEMQALWSQYIKADDTDPKKENLFGELNYFNEISEGYLAMHEVFHSGGFDKVTSSYMYDEKSAPYQIGQLRYILHLQVLLSSIDVDL